MTLMEAYLKEYIAICSYLEQQNCKLSRGCFVVERGRIDKLLRKNAFDTPTRKLQIWKQMNWIRADDDRKTGRIYVAETHKYIRVILIRRDPFELIQQLQSHEFTSNPTGHITTN